MSWTAGTQPGVGSVFLLASLKKPRELHQKNNPTPGTQLVPLTELLRWQPSKWALRCWRLSAATKRGPETRPAAPGMATAVCLPGPRNDHCCLLAQSHPKLAVGSESFPRAPHQAEASRCSPRSRQALSPAFHPVLTSSAIAVPLVLCPRTTASRSGQGSSCGRCPRCLPSRRWKRTRATVAVRVALLRAAVVARLVARAEIPNRAVQTRQALVPMQQGNG